MNLLIENLPNLTRIDTIIAHHDTCRLTERQVRELSEYEVRMNTMDCRTPNIQYNKNCHDDYPKTLAFQKPLRYHGNGKTNGIFRQQS